MNKRTLKKFTSENYEVRVSLAKIEIESRKYGWKQTYLSTNSWYNVILKVLEDGKIPIESVGFALMSGVMFWVDYQLLENYMLLIKPKDVN
jgi:hypothetical protein